MTISATTRDKQLRDRATRDYQALQAQGLTTGETFYPPGTEAVLGLASVRRARQAFLEMPDAREALGALADKVVAESRVDVPCMLGNEWANPDETITWLQPSAIGGFAVAKKRSEQPPAYLAPTEQALNQVAARCPVGHPAPKFDIGAWLPALKGTPVVLRTRALPEARRSAYQARCARELYAVVGPGYKPYDLDAAAHDLAEACPQDSKARIRYDGARARVDVVLQNPYKLDGGDAAAVGETHRIVLRMKTADDGSGGYHLSLLAERVRCINLTLLHASKSLVHASHRREDLRALVQQALDQVAPTFAAFADTWRVAWGECYMDRFSHTGLSGEESLKRIVGNGKYRIAGLGEEGTLAAVLAALNEEPGDSRAHVHNALTRAAHAAPTSWASRWADEQAEEQASQLLYAHVLTLSPTEEQAV